MHRFLSIAIQYLVLVLSVGLSQIVWADKTFRQHGHDIAHLQNKELTEADLAWLKQKKVLRIGVSLPAELPLSDARNPSQHYGINTDELCLLQNLLQISIEIRSFTNEWRAKEAVAAGEIDILLTHLETKTDRDPRLIYSPLQMRSYPVLVVAQNKVMLPLHSRKKVDIAVVDHYPLFPFIRESFPSANIVHYQSLQAALHSVYQGTNDYFIGDSLMTGNSIENEFSHTLKMITFWPEKRSESHFLALAENKNLLEIVNSSLTNLSLSDDMQLKSNYLAILNKTVLLTAEEKEWIAKHKKINVLINPYYIPFTMLDENGEIRGIVGDVLNLITLQTGLRFEAIPEISNQRMAERIKKGQWSLLPAITYSAEREKIISFSEPFVSSPLVVVVKSGSDIVTEINEKMKIAVPAHSISVEWLKKYYPTASLVLVDNSSIAITLLNEDKVDAAVSNKLVATYMISHYYPISLTYFLLPIQAFAQISFGIPKDDEILTSIINKSLNNIPKSEILRLVNEWVTMPNVKVDTWELYRKPFYYVITLSTILILSTLFWGGYLLREVRQRKKTQGDLEYQLNFRNTLSDAIPMPLYLVSMQGRLLSYNNAFSRFFNHEKADNFSDNLNETDHPIHTIYTFLQQNSSSSVKDKSVHLHHLDLFNGFDKRSLLHWSTFCIMPSNKDPLIICGWQDVTDSVRLMSALQREKDKAIDATRAKSLFLSRMSHEIRTPISAVIGFLELLATQQQSPQETKKAIQLAYETSRSLLSLIGDVLDMEKIESGHFQLAVEWVSLDGIVQDVLMMFDALARQKRIALRNCNELDDDILLLLDPQVIKQILTNLVSNALKFIHHGYIEIQTKLFKNIDNKGLLSIRIVDTGMGISEEDQKKLFRPFSQTKEGRLQTGSGLGLVICQELLSFMQGEIAISSLPGQGTAFILSIPVDFVYGKSNKEIRITNDITLPHALSILIADDHQVNRMLLRSQLFSLGYQIDEASNGLEALSFIESNYYDLLITDLNMPEMDGISLTRSVRQFNHHLTIWGLTANAQYEDREAGLASGMDLCLFKPLNLTELKRNLAALKIKVKGRSAGKIECINISVLQDKMAVNYPFFNNMLTVAQQENRLDLVAARRACQASNREDLNKSLHRMKGAAQIIGALCLLSRIQHLEQQSHQGSEFSTLEKSLDQIEEEILHLERYIKGYFSEDDSYLQNDEDL